MNNTTKQNRVFIPVEPKKGAKAETLWKVAQNREYAYIDCSCSTLRWRNDNGIFPAYGNKRGLPRVYSVMQLRLDIDEAGEKNDLTDGAGYIVREHGKDDYTTPGAIALRGQTLGVITAEISFHNGEPWARWKVRDYKEPSPGERDWLNKNILPGLAAFIQNRKAELRRDCLEAMRLDLETKTFEARQSLAALEVEAKQAMRELEAQRE